MSSEDSSIARLAAIVEAFGSALTREDAADHLDAFRVPGDLGTRSRWFFLLDAERRELDASRIMACDVDSWLADIDLENRAEAAEINLDNSYPLWRTPLEHEQQPYYYRIVSLNALLGLADHFRRAEDRPSAREQPDEAERSANDAQLSAGERNPVRDRCRLGPLLVVSAAAVPTGRAMDRNRAPGAPPPPPISRSDRSRYSRTSRNCSSAGSHPSSTSTLGHRRGRRDEGGDPAFGLGQQLRR